MHPYLRLRLHVRAAGAEGSPSSSERRGRTDGGFHAPLLRRLFGKALIERFCPFGRPLCEGRPISQPGPRAVSEREPPLGPAQPDAAKAGSAPRPSGGRLPSPEDLCHLAATCPYGILFAASRTPRPPYAVFSPPGAEDGATGSVEVTLFGSAYRLYPWALTCLSEALRTGVGKERRPWRIEEIHRLRPDHHPERLAGGELAQLPATLAPDLLNLALEPYLAPQPVTVRFLSPARLLRDGRLLPGREPVPFALLIARILDRFAGLYGRDASDALRPEVRGAIEAEATGVPVVEDDTRWLEVRDYSARSRSELLLGGKVGRTVYGEGAARFFPILRAGEILHVGKNAASGCGRIEVDLPPPPAQ